MTFGKLTARWVGLEMGLSFLVGLMAATLVAQETPKAAPTETYARPPAPAPVGSATLEASVRRGVKFLVASQNRDGSWGTPAIKGGVPIYAGIGSHHAFGVAVTALCVSALIESGDNSPEVQRALALGERHLYYKLPTIRRDDPVKIYNIWTHAYGIQALVRLDQRLPNDSPQRRHIRELIRGQYEKLTKYESAEGGWGYYDFDAGTQRPASSSTSFVNAAVLVALREADSLGIAPPEKVLRRAIQMTKAQRLPDGSYLYGTYLRTAPTMTINRPGGSLGRSQACALSLRIWGDQDVTNAVLERWLDRLITRNGWLSHGRKKPVPHESFFQVAGYFFYFGHYYAGLCLEQLPRENQDFYKHHLARIILDLQEADGSWYDYPFYNYHKPYGTAFAIMTLNSCRSQTLRPVPLSAPK